MQPRRYMIVTALSLFLVLLALLAGAALAATVTVSAPTVEAQAGNPVNVPIQMSGANGLGAVHLELTFDPAVLTAQEVTKGALAGNNALMESNIKEPGRVVIGIVSLDGITGDGTLASVNFNVVGDAGINSSLAWANNQAWERESHAEVLVNAQPGQVTIAAGLPSWLIPVAVAGTIVLLVVLFFIFFASRRRKEPQPAYAAAGSAPVSASPTLPASPLPSNAAPPKGAPGRPLPPSGLPESRAPTNSQTNVADFKRTEDEYFKLKGLLSTGRLTQEQYEAKLRELMVQDGQGRYWMLGADTGKWYLHDGQTWTEAQPY